MPINFYQVISSAPCRAVALAAAAVGVEMNFKHVDVMKGDQLKPEYVKMNPQHTVPTIDDNGFYLWESRAIMVYLVEQYSNDDTLYPKDPKQRAIVNQRLYFDACTFYPAFSDYFYPMIFAKAMVYGEKNEKIDEALSLLELFLKGEKYVAGKNMTIADLSVVVTVSLLEVLEYELSEYKNISRWYSMMKLYAPKYDEYNDVGVKLFKTLVDEAMKKESN